MKKFILLMACLIKLVIAFTQLTITLQVPQSGVLLKPQLWSAVVGNSYPATKQIYIGLTLSDAVSGQPVMTATTTKFNVASGALQITEASISPIGYDYLSPDINDRNPEGYLPAGSYTACYTVFLADEGNGSPASEQCVPVVIEPVSPPLLNIPFNQQVINSPFPQFSWIPPAPLEIFSDLSYDFVLVEVQEGQAAADAIQQNLPLYANNTGDIYLNYPASSLSLDTGKVYAWQITAKNNGQYAAQSDIWTFSLADTTLQAISAGINQYIKLKRSLDATIGASVGDLKLYYDNEEDTMITYSIYDIDPNDQDNTSMQLLTTDSMKVKPGVNLISVPLTGVNGIGDGKQYLFQLTNSRNELWSTKFIYYKKD